MNNKYDNDGLTKACLMLTKAFPPEPFREKEFSIKAITKDGIAEEYYVYAIDKERAMEKFVSNFGNTLYVVSVERT